MKLSPNSPCPCGSGNKYKKCCQRYHKGARAQNALTLMKSRYSAYAAGESDYIIHSTHPDNPDYGAERKKWKQEIRNFCMHTTFLGLEILDFTEGEDTAFVTFKAMLDSDTMLERSRFVKIEGRWLYVEGEMLQAGDLVTLRER